MPCQECMGRFTVQKKKIALDIFLPSAYERQGKVREDRVVTGLGTFCGGDLMKGKTTFSLLAVFMLLFVLVSPLAAAEQTFDLTIPGCTG